MEIFRKFALLIVFSALSACASITAVEINSSDGHRKDDKSEPGIRYYLPKAYLLVAELPESQIPATAAKAAATAKGGKGAAKPTDTTGQNDGTSSTKGAETAAPSSQPSDTSFSATMASYSIKLIYLPDFEHPMVLQVTSGWLGTATFAPTFQDGWMLTSLNGSADSGGSSAITALAGLMAGGSSSAGASGKSAKSASAAVAPDTSLEPNTASNGALKDYSDVKLVQYGQSVGGGASAYPAQSEIDSLNSSQQKLFYAGVAAGAQANQLTKPSTTWGSAVLHPGLYAIDSSGFTAVAIFCKDKAPATTISDDCKHN